MDDVCRKNLLHCLMILAQRFTSDENIRYQDILNIIFYYKIH